MKDSEIKESIQKWLSSMVIGLGLCPFAEKPFRAGTIRYTVCPSHDPSDVLKALAEELQKLAAAPRSEWETTLLIAPAIYPEFLDFNDFVADCEQLVEDLELAGTIQIVGFHPGFYFADTAKEAAENYTNRSPYPLIHLLREESITEVSSQPEELREIPKRNTLTLQRLGVDKILERLESQGIKLS